ncbi:MAG: energy-coupling factor transporter transmembrane protein EcfT [Spirochaetaceae bacterium]|jgi:energy-coupling factor transport system permease protein|nr:energy-coupling factor transporter transmembrane protein EcfT [Spirochaetaceae bacterium]
MADKSKQLVRSKKGSSYIPIDSPIDRLHPMVKIYGVLCLGIGAAVFPGFVLAYILVVFLFFIGAKAKLLKKFAKFVLGFAVPILVMLMFIQGLYSPKNVTVIADFGFAKLGLEGVLYALKIVGTLLVFLGGFFLMTTTTYPGKLVTALQNAGMNPRGGYLILASLNVVPQIQRRIVIIQEAQTARGVEVDGSLRIRAKAFLPIIGPVVMSSLVDVQERGMTLETRGFGVKGVKPSSYVELTITPAEKKAKAALVTFLALCVLTAIAWKIKSYLGV